MPGSSDHLQSRLATRSLVRAASRGIKQASHQAFGTKAVVEPGSDRLGNFAAVPRLRTTSAGRRVELCQPKLWCNTHQGGKPIGEAQGHLPTKEIGQQNRSGLARSFSFAPTATIPPFNYGEVNHSNTDKNKQCCCGDSQALTQDWRLQRFRQHLRSSGCRHHCDPTPPWQSRS